MKKEVKAEDRCIHEAQLSVVISARKFQVLSELKKNQPRWIVTY